MIDFNKEDNQKKIGLNSDIRDLTNSQNNAKPEPKITSDEAKNIIEEEKAFRRGVLSVRDLISQASLKAEAKHLSLGNKFVRTIFIIGYPRYISVGWFAPIINLNLTFDVSMFFYPVKSAIILKQLQNKVGSISAQIISDAEKGAARDPLRETALHDIEYLRDSLTQGTEKFFQFSL